MKLYFSPGACSMAAHILLDEWNVPHTLEQVDLKTHKTQKGEDFYKINPKGYVPALVTDNGQTLTENIAVLFYLSDSRGDFRGDRYRFLEWLAFISTELHKGLGSLFGYPNGPQEIVAGIKNKAAKRLQWIDMQLEGKEYIFGPGFTAADAYLVTVLNWGPVLNVDLSPYQNIQAYMNNMMRRPSVQKTMQEEGLIK